MVVPGGEGLVWQRCQSDQCRWSLTGRQMRVSTACECRISGTVNGIDARFAGGRLAAVAVLLIVVLL